MSIFEYYIHHSHTRAHTYAYTAYTHAQTPYTYSYCIIHTHHAHTCTYTIHIRHAYIYTHAMHIHSPCTHMYIHHAHTPRIHMHIHIHHVHACTIHTHAHTPFQFIHSPRYIYLKISPLPKLLVYTMERRPRIGAGWCVVVHCARMWICVRFH